MEAPEKIYLQVCGDCTINDKETCEQCYKDYPISSSREVTWCVDQIFNNDVEYTRTDAFIEKVLKWYCLDCACNDNCATNHKCAFWSFFKEYLEGNDKALPPKISNAFNPDGSTTENYRYRHIIERMQDDFVEKACKFISDRVDIHFNVECSDGKPLAASYSKYLSARLEAANKTIEEFKNYMKGE